MHLKRYLKINKLCIFIFFQFSILHSQSINHNDKIKIIEMIYFDSNKMEEAWQLTYVSINGEIYSGAFFDDYGSTYNFTYDEKYKNYLINNLREKWHNSKTRKRHDSFFKLDTKIKNIDNYFFWRCFEISGDYLLVPAVMDKKDFFPFIYKKNKVVVGFININLKKIHVVNNLPYEMYTIIMENKVCIEKLNEVDTFDNYLKCY